MKETIVVTGGAGYIGSHTAYLLYKQGYNVVIIDDLLQNQKWQTDWAVHIKSDFADVNVLKYIFDKFKPTAVMHFAAFIEVGHSVSDPLRFYKNNVSKTLILLEQMLLNRIKKFVFSSSCAVYGDPEKLPLVETHHKNPVSPYGKNKLVVEMALEDFSYAYGLDYIALRYFNAAGCCADQGLGERHEPETHIIPLLIRAAENDKPFYIFGDDYPTADGTCIRDYLHVLDIADAHCKALEYLKNNNESDVFNLGIGTGNSVKQMIQAVEKITGKKIKIIFAHRRQGDPPVLVADNKKAQELLGWQIRYSELDNILRSAYEFEMLQAKQYLAEEKLEKVA